jgi:Fe-coproporphyrin III synthase
MIRFTHLLHGGGTVSRVYRHRTLPPRDVPGNMLPYTAVVRPVVFWNVTSRCNLSCGHCYLDAGPDRDTSGELTTTEALHLIDDLGDMGVPLLIISGGEPLLRRDIWEILVHARRKNMALALSSNGTLITREIAERLKNTGVEYVGISLDSADQRAHESFRKIPGCFGAALAGLRHCRDAGLRTGVRFTATRENCKDVGDLIRFSRELPADRFCIYWLVPSGRGQEIYDDQKVEPEDARALLDVLYQTTRETDPDTMEFLSVDAPSDIVYILERLRDEDPAEYTNALHLLECQGGGCSAGFRVASIDPTGNIYPCQFAQEERFLIGNARDRPFSITWNDDANIVLDMFRNKIERLKGTCGRCAYKTICGGGCRIRAWHATGDFWAEDPLCDRGR